MTTGSKSTEFGRVGPEPLYRNRSVGSGPDGIIAEITDSLHPNN